MKRLQITLIACTTLAAAGPAAAAEPVRMEPGLWEMSTRIQSSDPATSQAMDAAHARIAALPPEQRSRIEQTLAGRGIDIRFGADAITAHVCVTREMAERGVIAPQSIGNCRIEPGARSGDSVRFAAICSEPRSTVEGVTTFTSSRSFESRTTSTIELRGTTRLSTVEQSGRWIGKDCGTVAPEPAERRPQ